MDFKRTRRLVAANMKGGATKSTTTVQLALALTELGHRTLLVDVDEQTASSTRLLGLQPDGTLLRTALLDEDGELAPTVLETQWNVDVIAGGPSLKGIESELQSRFDSYASFKLKLLVDDLLTGHRGRWDFVLFDTRPNYGLTTTSAITTAEWVVAPVSDGGSLEGLRDLQANLRTTRLFNAAVKLLGVIPTKIDRTQVSKLARELVAEDPSVHIFSGIRNDQVFRKAELVGAPAQEVNPKAPSLDDFRKLAGELVQRFELLDGSVEAAE